MKLIGPICHLAIVRLIIMCAVTIVMVHGVKLKYVAKRPFLCTWQPLVCIMVRRLSRD